MGRTLQEVMQSLEPEHRQRVVDRADELEQEYYTLQELRKARDLTQVKLAEMLGWKQPSVAQLEKRSDIMLSTLKSVVEAMGGTLNVQVKFPEKKVVNLAGLGNTDTK